MTNIKRFYPHIRLVLILVLFLLLAMGVNTRSIKFSSESANSLDECWSFTAYPMCVNLPADVSVSANEPYTVSKELPSDFDQSQVILLRTSLQNVEVRLDNELIYSVNYDDEATYASMWHMVDIPHESAGQTLSLTFSSPYTAMSGTVNEVYYGSDLSLHSYLISTFGFRAFIGVFILIVGLFMLIGSAIYKPKQSDGYSYVGLFSIFMSFWVISESRLLQYITGNIFIIGSLSYLSLSLFPIPIIRYLKKYVLKKFGFPLSILYILFILNVGLILALHLMAIASFFETVIITLLLITIALIIIISLLVLEYKKYDNKKSLRPLMLLGILFVFGIFEVANFFTGNFDRTSTFLVIGLLCVMILIITRYGRFVMDRFRQSYEKEFYEKLAYVDPLTGAKNRLSFEKDLKKYFNHPTIRSTLRLLYFDLDNLKRINDDFGHTEGDRVLKLGFSIIESVFGDYGSCYRIGGDEFACIAVDLTEALYKEKEKALEAMFTAYKDEPYPIRLSVGSKVYEEHLTIDAFIKHADQAMYDNKKSFKGRGI